MAKTVVGLFDTLTEAQEVVQELLARGFRQKDVSVVAHDTKGEVVKKGDNDAGESEAHHEAGNHAGEAAGSGAVTGTILGGGLGLILGILGATAIPVIGPIVAAGPILAALTGAGIGAAAGGLIGALTGAGVPDEDAQYYAEGVHRGGTLVTVHASDNDAQSAYDIMQNHGAVDIDERGEEYKETGWAGYNPDAKPYSSQEVETYRSKLAATPSNVVTTSSTNTNTSTPVEAVAATPAPAPEPALMRSVTPPVETPKSVEGDMVIPIVQEELQVGKRQVQRGGVRVYTRIEEKPVEEQVELREEQVKIERRAVNRDVSEGDLATFKDGTIEITTMAEEAVVAKQARVVEEVVIEKSVTENVETVHDSVRRTDVQVDRLDGVLVGSGATAVGYDTFDTDFRNDFQTNYAKGVYTYEQYAPGYHYGYELSSDKSYAGKDWTSIEPQVQKDWESKNPDSKWNDFKDTIKYAWNKASGQS